MRSTIRRIAPIATVAMTVAFLACEESPTSIDAPADANTVRQLSADAGNPVVRSARGSGHAQTEGNPNFSESGWRVLTFNASQRQDGTTTGNMKYEVHDQGDPAVTHRVKGQIFCMAELGNGMIAIGAEGTQRTPYDQPPIFAPFGTPLLPPAVLPDDWGIFFVVRDNGEGAGVRSGPVHGSCTHESGERERRLRFGRGPSTGGTGGRIPQRCRGGQHPGELVTAS